LPGNVTVLEDGFMRAFPLVVITALLFWLAPAPALAQRLDCHPNSHAFFKVQIGNSDSYSFQVTNTGSHTLSINSKSIQGGSAFSFGKFPLPMKLQPGASVQLTVIFNPTAKGYTHGVVTLISNDPYSPSIIHVYGTGVGTSQGDLGMAPTALDFGSVAVGSSASLPATLTASGAAVTISSDGSNSSEFAVVGLSLPVTIQAGGSLPVTVQFTPNASGKASGKVGFTSNAENSPTVASVTGTGVAQQAHNVYLSWQPGDGNAVGYNVYRGTAKSGPFQEINSALDASTNYTDYTVISGTTYYYVATEVNAQGQESAYSNEVQAVIPNP
jgi:hypothetical protein